MKFKHYVLILIFACIQFSGLFLRPDIVGFDSYHYLNLICGQENYLGPELPGTVFLLGLLPCNILLLKLIMFLLYFISLVIVAKTGELFDKEHGWLAAPFTAISVVFLRSFSNFENEIFAWPLILLAIYFFYRKYNLKHQAVSLLGIIAATWFWLGSWITLSGLMLGGKNLQFMLIGCAVIFFFLGSMVESAASQIAPSQVITESQTILGLASLGLLAFGIFGCFWIPSLVLPGVLFTFIACWNPKFAFFSIPFLAIGLTQTGKIHKLLPAFLVVLSVVMAIAGGVALLLAEPSQGMHQAIDYAVMKADGSKMQNNWDIGYIVRAHGGITDDYGGGIWGQQFRQEGIVLTYSDMNCRLYAEFPGGLYEKWKVYACTDSE